MNTNVAHQARVYDYLLGGKDNYDVDREAAHRAFAAYPGGVAGASALARANRAFLGRAVHYLASDAGIGQFLDIGTGIPTANNTHEVAQRVAPESRIVYVDKDPIVLAHARALLSGTREGATHYIDADLRDPDKILQEAAGTLDLGQPVAIMLVLILHMLADEEDPYQVVARLLEAVPVGSYLVIAHAANDIQRELVEANEVISKRMTEPVFPRSYPEVARFFDGLELVEPGVVPVNQWRPGVGVPGAGSEFAIHCGVGRKV
ncbi:MAG: SAM-dependent methyltransferase [Streptosporangiales bacterium]|nr:SAM-dependent methyltransferase [Streptosporangiales bacterium]